MTEYGLTEAEQAVMKMPGEFFRAFEALPQLHPADLEEVAFHVHALGRIVFEPRIERIPISFRTNLGRRSRRFAVASLRFRQPRCGCGGVKFVRYCHFGQLLAGLPKAPQLFWGRPIPPSRRILAINRRRAARLMTSSSAASTVAENVRVPRISLAWRSFSWSMSKDVLAKERSPGGFEV
jgi:hypothetical protein